MTFKLRVRDQFGRVGEHVCISEMVALQRARDLGSTVQKGTIVDLTLPDDTILSREEIERRIAQLPPAVR